VRGAETRRFRRIGAHVAIAIKLKCGEGFVDMSAAQQAAFAQQPSKAAHSVSAARKTEQVKLIAGLIIEVEEEISAEKVIVQIVAGDALPKVEPVE
jgi:hypothetical protein